MVNGHGGIRQGDGKIERGVCHLGMLVEHAAPSQAPGGQAILKSLVLVTLVLLGVLGANTARSQTWSTPVDISSGITESKHPAIAIGPGGDVHVVWEAFTSPNWEILYSRKPVGGVWTSPVNVSNTSGASNRPAIAVGEDGSLHVVWHDAAAGDWDILCSTKSADGSWSPASNISNNAGWSFHPEIVVGGDGSLHVVWHDNTSGKWQILYASKPVDGSWSPPTPVWTEGGRSWFAALAIGGGGNLHLVWEERTPGNWEILYSAKPPGGSWLWPENVSRTNGESRLPALVVASDGSPRVVWQDETSGSPHLASAARVQAGSWSSAEDISEDIVRSSRPAIAAVRDGTLHVAWAGDRFGSTDILFATSPPGGSWSSAANVSHSVGVSDGLALGVGADGSTHTVWHDNTPGSNHIFYAGPSSATAAAPPFVTAPTLPEAGTGGSGGGVGQSTVMLAVGGAGSVILTATLVLLVRRRRARH